MTTHDAPPFCDLTSCVPSGRELLVSLSKLESPKHPQHLLSGESSHLLSRVFSSYSTCLFLKGLIIWRVAGKGTTAGIQSFIQEIFT